MTSKKRSLTPRTRPIEAVEPRTLFAATLAFAHEFGDSSALTGTFGNSVAVDATGNTYFVGGFSGTVDFNPSPTKTFNLTATTGQANPFVAKYAPNGSLLWAVAAKGSGGSESDSVAVCKDGSIWVGGDLAGTADFNPAKPLFNLTAKGAHDIFLWKLSSAGKFLTAVRGGGAGATDSITTVAVNAAGDVYASGYCNATSVFGAQKIKSAGDNDGFVTKVSKAGKFVFTKIIGGASLDRATSVALDSAGNVYATGLFSGAVNFNKGGAGGALTSLGPNETFVLKLDSAGHFKFVRRFGSSTTSQTNGSLGQSIALDHSGNIYVGGAYGGTTDFNPGTGVHNLTSTGVGDLFVTKLNAAGNFVWAKSAGSTFADGLNSISVDKAGSVYITGQFGGNGDFDPGPKISNLVGTPNLANGFVWKLTSAGNFVLARAFVTDAGNFCEGSGIATDAKGDIYVSLRFQGGVDFDPGAGVLKSTTGNSTVLEGALIKLTP